MSFKCKHCDDTDHMNMANKTCCRRCQNKRRAITRQAKMAVDPTQKALLNIEARTFRRTRTESVIHTSVGPHRVVY